MGSEIAANLLLDCVTCHILPENRYDICISSSGKEEIMGHGPLDQILEHLSNFKDQLAKGYCDKFKLELPDVVDHRSWFTKSTLTRFLHIIGSPDSLKKAFAISNEMSQLEDTKKFHLSLYAKAEDEFVSSNTSKNELLRAMDSRLAALTEELVSAFNVAAGATICCQQMMDLEEFCRHFGEVDIRNLLSKLSETSQKGQNVVPLENKKSHVPLMLKNDDVNKMGGNTQLSGPTNPDKPVKYNASPAKAAEVERESSTESEDSSFSSEDDHASAERSRTLIRSASPRRSASPMRRIQVGRSGSRRTPAITIKSLTFFPARERISSHRDSVNDCKSEDSEEQSKKTEVNVTRMSVQDAISLFESKQRDQKVDAQKKSLVDNSTNTSKAVLRRWSSGMGESQKSLARNMLDHTASDDDANLVDDNANRDSGVKPETGPASENPGSEERPRFDIEQETSDKIALDLDENDCPGSRAEETKDKLDSAEWSRQKEAELNQMLMKFAEFNQSSQKKAEGDNIDNQSSHLEKRDEFHGHQKGRRDERPRRESVVKRVEKPAELRAKPRAVDKPKSERSSTKSDVGKKQNSSRTLGVSKSSPFSSNAKKESTKPAVPKKAPSKSSPLPATRKSWPLMPSPRATGTLPAKIPTGTPPSGTTAPRQKSQSPAPLQKPQSPASVPRSSPKPERSPLQQKDVRKPPVDTKKNLKKVDESKTKTQVMPKGGKTAKPKIVMSPKEDVGSVARAKAVVRKKVTKKSSVVPLEAKPSSRKVPGNSPVRNPIVQKTETATQAEEALSKPEDPVNIQENIEAAISDIVHLVEGDPVSETHSGQLELEKEAEIEKPKNRDEKYGSEEAPTQNDEIADRMSDSPAEIQPEHEPVISPAAWEESSQQDLPVPSVNSFGPSPANPDAVASSGPRVRHSLSQMLLEESSEPDIIEWGNAENPPAMIYQKDAPKGLKRLLKFARKNKGEANGASWASPYTSEGEDDGDEYKSLGKRNSDNLLKIALHSKNYGESFLSDSEPLSARSNVSNSSSRSSNKFQEGHATSKGTRSFFSLSAFRGNKN